MLPVLKLINSNKKLKIGTIFKWSTSVIRQKRNYSEMPKPPGYWLDMRNQRLFLDKLWKEFNVNSFGDWVKITPRQLLERGGRDLLIGQYEGSMFKALSRIYPEHTWDPNLFSNRPLDEEDLNVPVYNGNKEYLNKDENKDDDKGKQKLPRNYWKSPDNQKKFLDELMEEFKLSEPNDLAKVDVDEQIEIKGAKNFIRRWYDGSIVQTIQRLYPLAKVDEEYFKKEAEERAKIPKVKGARRKKVTYSPPSYTPSPVYTNAPPSALPPEKEYPEGHFASLENQKTFLEELKDQFKIQKPEDWIVVNLNTIRIKGGQPLLNLYEGSLIKTLQAVYTSEDFTPLTKIEQDQMNKSNQTVISDLKLWTGTEGQATQSTDLGSAPRPPAPTLTGAAQATSSGTAMFSKNVDILVNYKHPQLKHKSGNDMELDIFIPQYKLAFEYQGPHHYKETFMTSLTEQKNRDKEKREKCAELGITLIVVPFWWDYTEEQLFQSVVKARPDLLPVLNVDPKLKASVDPSKAIPDVQPGKSTKKIESPTITPGKDFVLLAKLWNPKNDPTNMWISEKYDGVRAYWDGENMFYRNGNPITVPPWFKEKIPKGVHFDGELWAGRLSFIMCQRKVSTKEWDDISYQIFDAPKFKGMYEQRHQFLKSLIDPENPFVKVAPIVKCESNGHLMEVLDEILRGGGEGLMLRKPNSEYFAGRSGNCLKVKPTFIEKCEVLELEEVASLDKPRQCTVKNKCGRQFPLYSKVSQSRFPTLKVGSVVTIGFGGLSITGIPRFPQMMEVHDTVEWDKVMPYYLDVGSKYIKHVGCEGCGKQIENGELRAHGMLWPHLGFGHEATYQQYSFCANKECLKTGTQGLQKRGVEHPPFENLVGIENRFEKKIEGNQAAIDALKALQENDIKVVPAKAPWITEEYWVFNEYTRMTRGE